MAVFKRPNGFKGMSQRFWGKETLAGLDVQGATNQLLGKGRKGCAIVILGTEGETLYAGSDINKGSSFYRAAGNPKVPFADLRKNITAHLDKGLLGGLKVPVMMRPVAKAVRAGQLGGAQMMLARAPDAGAPGEFKKALLKRLEALRVKKRALFDSLMAAGKKWDAYKVGSSYVRCFPKAKDMSEVRRSVSSMNFKKPVKQNLAARRIFFQIAAMAYGSKARAGMAAQAGKAFEQLASMHPDTEYGKHAAEISK